MKRILILYTSVGHGHKVISENIGTALKSSFEVDLVDLAELEKTSKLMDGGSKFYFWMIAYWPGLWKFFYTNKVFLALTLPFRVPVAGLKYQKVLAVLQKKNYNAVICAHVNASAILSFLKKKGLYKGKFIVAFSDFHLHSYWVFNNVDLFLANILEQKQQMVVDGIATDKILVCGMTMQPRKHFDPGAVREKFGLKSEDKVILMMSGSKGLVFNFNLVEQIKNLNAKIFIVCGKNPELEKELQTKFAAQKNIKILGYIDLQELYAITDLVLTKPGALTVSECLQAGLPMIIHSLLPMEKFNYDYLLAKKLVMPAESNIRAEIEGELAAGQFAQSLKSNPAVAAIIQDGSKIRQKLTELV